MLFCYWCLLGFSCCLKSDVSSLDANVYRKRAQVGPGWSRRMHAVHVIACCLLQAGCVLSSERLISSQCPDFYDFVRHSWRFQSRLTLALSKKRHAGLLGRCQQSDKVVVHGPVNVFFMLPSLCGTIVIRQVIGRKWGRQPRGTREKCTAARRAENLNT